MVELHYSSRALADDLYEIADELRAVANQGLHFDQDAFARER